MKSLKTLLVEETKHKLGLDYIEIQLAEIKRHLQKLGFTVYEGYQISRSCVELKIGLFWDVGETRYELQGKLYAGITLLEARPKNIDTIQPGKSHSFAYSVFATVAKAEGITYQQRNMLGVKHEEGFNIPHTMRSDLILFFVPY